VVWLIDSFRNFVIFVLAVPIGLRVIGIL